MQLCNDLCKCEFNVTNGVDKDDWWSFNVFFFFLFDLIRQISVLSITTMNDDIHINIVGWICMRLY